MAYTIYNSAKYQSNPNWPSIQPGAAKMADMYKEHDVYVQHTDDTVIVHMESDLNYSDMIESLRNNMLECFPMYNKFELVTEMHTKHSGPAMTTNLGEVRKSVDTFHTLSLAFSR